MLPMQINKYLQHIIRKEEGCQGKSIQECLRVIEERKAREQRTYLELCMRRMRRP